MSSINLEPLTLYHLEWARQLHNDPQVLRMLTDPHPVSLGEQRVWFKKLEESETSKRLVAFLNDKTPIGIVRIDQIDQYNRSACVGLDIQQQYRGKKLAKPIYKKIFRLCFEEWGLNRVWLTVASYNKIALNLYDQLGFREEGVQREALFRDGQYHDYIVKGLLKREWEEWSLNDSVV